jgi:DnaJ-class molecular chaperone
MNPTSEDPAGLLSDERQWTEPWGSSEDGASCDKCDGTGRTGHECWSCLLTGARENCPVCSGAVRWEDECPVCRGIGRVDGEPRPGVSVFPTVEGLYRYMLATDADVDECLIVELDADPAGDVDFDADQGAMLVIPRRIAGCAAVDREMVRRVEERIGSERA